jgi:hypothetical protein
MWIVSDRLVAFVALCIALFFLFIWFNGPSGTMMKLLPTSGKATEGLFSQNSDESKEVQNCAGFDGHATALALCQEGHLRSAHIEKAKDELTNNFFDEAIAEFEAANALPP